jgi:hypothetical protein
MALPLSHAGIKQRLHRGRLLPPRLFCCIPVAARPASTALRQQQGGIGMALKRAKLQLPLGSHIVARTSQI